MKKLLILLLFSFPLVAEEKIKLLCEGTKWLSGKDPKGKEFSHDYPNTSKVINIDDKVITVDYIRYEKRSLDLEQKNSSSDRYTDYRKTEDKIYYYGEGGPAPIDVEGNINRMTGEITERSYIHILEWSSYFEGKCRKAERAF